MEEFQSALASCNESAPGADDITYSIYHGSHKFLLSIINRIWKESAFPSVWDIAILLPFLKPCKDGSSLSNYRPIALTSCICKLIENGECTIYMVSRTKKNYKRQRSVAFVGYIHAQIS